MLNALVVASALMACRMQAELPAAVQATRAAEVGRLIAAAAPPLAKSDHDAKYPVQVLGTLRAEEAVPLLVEHLGYMPPNRKLGPSDKSSRLLRDMLPCVYALAKIGHPALDAVVKKACETDDSHHVMCAAITLRVAFGADDAITLLRAREVACKDGRQRARIEQVITKIDKIYRHVNFQ